MAAVGSKRKSREIEGKDENVEPNMPQKKKLSLSLKNNKKQKGSRFATVSDFQLEAMSSYKMPKNSATSSRWALKNLNDWRLEHNDRNPTKICPEDILSPYCIARNC